tara:strand:- start:97 stop:516 length:420 start_codon:yes stop_codon:yes gene_type:complete
MPNSNPFSFNASSVIDTSFNPIRSSTSNRSGGYKNPLGQTEYKDNLSFGSKSGGFSSGISTFAKNYESPLTSFQSGASTFGKNYESPLTSFQSGVSTFGSSNASSFTKKDIYSPWGPSSVGNNRGSAWGNGIASRNTFQ